MTNMILDASLQIEIQNAVKGLPTHRYGGPNDQPEAFDRTRAVMYEVPLNREGYASSGRYAGMYYGTGARVFGLQFEDMRSNEFRANDRRQASRCAKLAGIRIVKGF